MASFGEMMLWLSTLLSAAGGGLCLARGTQRRFYGVSRSLFTAAAAASAVALVALVFLLVVHDYRVEYVRDYADRTMSLGFLITAVWGGQAGSLMLWAVLQTWFTAAAAAWYSRREDLTRAPIAFGFLSAVQIFFLLLTVFHSSPFEPLGTVATDGVGLNPLLRNFYMVLHPPTLYLGFVGFSVPMAFALASMAEGVLDDGWLRDQRPWILFAWIFLSVGNVLGMVWAYEELGWGGYWGWDPVENAAFLPWLTGTALVHSAMAEERRGVLRRWNIFLIAITFVLIVFGTFLTRSGVIESVHAFAGATTGPYFLGMIAVSGLAAIALLLLRFRRLAPKNRPGPILSRDWSLMINNWVFLAAAVFVWVATMMPLFAEVFRGEKITMTPEFFNRWMVPIGLVVLALLGLCTAMGWRVGARKDLFSRFAAPVFAGVLVGTWSVFMGSVNPSLGRVMAFAPALSLGILGMVAAAVLVAMRKTFVEGAREGRAASTLRRRLGGQLVHVSVILLFVGFTGAGFTSEAQGLMGPGDYMNVAGYRIGFVGLREISDFEKRAVFADLAIKSPGGEDLGVMSPARFVYHSHPRQPTSEVVIDTGLGEDLFLVLGETDPRGRAVIKVVVNPLVIWLWIGGFLMVIGTIVAMLRPGWFVDLLRMTPEVRAALVRPLVVFSGMAIVSLGFGLAMGLPEGLVALGAVILMILLYNFAAALRVAVSDGGEA